MNPQPLKKSSIQNSPVKTTRKRPNPYAKDYTNKITTADQLIKYIDRMNTTTSPYAGRRRKPSIEKRAIKSYLEDNTKILEYALIALLNIGISTLKIYESIPEKLETGIYLLTTNNTAIQEIQQKIIDETLSTLPGNNTSIEQLDGFDKLLKELTSDTLTFSKNSASLKHTKTSASANDEMDNILTEFGLS